MPTTISEPQAMPTETRRLTGRGFFVIMVAVFGFIFAVNGYMVYQAIASFPGVVTESSYRDGQRFNAEIAAARAQAERAWKVDVTADRAADRTVRVNLAAVDPAGAPVTGVGFHVLLRSPHGAAHDRSADLAPVVGASGRWQGVVSDVDTGKWTMEVQGDGASGRLFLSENALLFE